MVCLFMEKDMEICTSCALGFSKWRASALIPICIAGTPTLMNALPGSALFAKVCGASDDSIKRAPARFSTYSGYTVQCIDYDPN